MPPLVGVVVHSANAPRQSEGLGVIVTVGWKRVVKVAAFLDGPHPFVIAEGHAREQDEVHGLSRLASFRRLEQNHLQ